MASLSNIPKTADENLILFFKGFEASLGAQALDLHFETERQIGKLGKNDQQAEIIITATLIRSWIKNHPLSLRIQSLNLSGSG